MPTLVASSSISTQYEIDNSLRFNDGDSAKLGRTPSSAGNRKTFTFSSWFKRSNIGIGVQLFDANGTGSTENDFLKINSNDTMQFRIKNSNSVVTNIIPTQVFRDPSAWYHIVLVWDTTQSTASNRVKIYINGNQVTAFSTASYPSQNLETSSYNNTVVHSIGAEYYQNGYYTYYDGYMAETHFIDGTAKAPTDFGEVDDNGVWIPKAYDGTYGTNGFYLEFKETGTGTNASGMGADTSGNDNHFAPTNLAATDVTTDTPTNNFATWNPLDLSLAQPPTLYEGNLQLYQPASGYSSNCNFGVSQGKWYFEWKPTVVNNVWLGIAPQNLYPAGNNLFTANKTIGMYAGNPNLYQDGVAKGSLGGGLSNNDIVSFAMDIDNSKLYLAINGSWNDGLGGGFDQSDFANANGFAFTKQADDFYVVATVNGSGAAVYQVQMNFGNAPYAISSGNADANGYGNFEYAVPSGFYSLCTKNLAEFG